MPTGGIDPSGVDDMNEEEERIHGFGLHHRGHRSARRTSDSDHDGVPSHSKTKRGRR